MAECRRRGTFIPTALFAGVMWGRNDRVRAVYRCRRWAPGTSDAMTAKRTSVAVIMRVSADVPAASGMSANNAEPCGCLSSATRQRKHRVAPSSGVKRASIQATGSGGVDSPRRPSVNAGLRRPRLTSWLCGDDRPGAAAPPLAICGTNQERARWLAILALTTAALAQFPLVLVVATVVDAALDAPPSRVLSAHLCGALPHEPEACGPTEGQCPQPGDGAPPRGPRCQLLAHAIESSRVHELLLRLLTYWPPAPWPRRLVIGRRGSRAGPEFRSPAP